MKKRYPYRNELRGPNVYAGNMKLTNPFLRLFFWLNHVRAVRTKPILSTTKSTIRVPGEHGVLIDCIVITPDRIDPAAPTIIDFHGGGFFGGLSIAVLQKACFYADELKGKVFLPLYRTSYRHKFPTPVEDCFEAASWIVAHADELQVNRDKIVVYGDSAGGCLAAAVTLMARDRKAFPIAFQMLIYPVTDLLQEGESLKTYADGNWSAAANKQMWPLYLGEKDPENVGYASPLRADSLSDLPPAYVEPQEYDSLRDDGIAYAKRLGASGVPVILNMIEGSYHAFEEEYPSPFVVSVLRHRTDVLRTHFNIPKP
ncbi:MAG: alpha/beta hydrolase [Bacillota bacterium]|nr:alpha/beta hydrolase [Bacillota bacterium]